MHSQPLAPNPGQGRSLVTQLLTAALSQPPAAALSDLLQAMAAFCGGVAPVIWRLTAEGTALPETGGSTSALVLSPDMRALLLQGQAVPVPGGVDLPLHDGDELYGLLRCARPAGQDPADMPDLLALAAAVSALISRRMTDGCVQAAVEALEATQQRLNASLRAMPDLVLELDDEGVYIDVHTSEPALLATTRDTLLGRSYKDVMPPAAQEVVRLGLMRARTEGRAHGCRYALPLEGSERWFEASIGRTAPGPQQPSGGFVVAIHDITDEQNRRTELIRLSHVAQQMTNYAIITDERFRVVWINPAFEARCGYPLAGLAGLDPRQVLRPEGPLSDGAKRIDRAIQDSRPERVEVCNQDRHGQVYWVDSSLTPIRDDQGQLLGFLSVETDITARRLQDENLKRLSEEAVRTRNFLEAAIDVLPDAFSIYDADDRLAVCNQPYLDYLAPFAPDAAPGVTYDHLLRQGVAAGRYPEAEGREEAFIALQLARARSAAPAQELQVSDGRWFRIYDKPMPAGGRVGMRTDITEIKTATQKLQDVLAVSGAGSWEFDLDAGKLQVNDRWAQMLGLEHAALTEERLRRWTRLIHPEDKPWLREVFTQIETGEIQEFAVEYRLRHSAGHWVWVQSRGRAILRHPDGRARRVVGAILTSLR